MRKQTQIMYIRRELNGGSLNTKLMKGIASSVFSNIYSSWNVVAFAIMLRKHSIIETITDKSFESVVIMICFLYTFLIILVFHINILIGCHSVSKSI
jgi:hypothetical protein